jgi:AAA domain-containing protein
LDRSFVVISGIPGSGKTQLGRQLAAALHLTFLDKDDLLDRLFEQRGTGDPAWRRMLSRESDGLLEREAAASAGAVLVSFWHQPGMPGGSGTPTNWLAALSPRLVHVHCVCAPELAAARFLQRQRHRGHLDRHVVPNDLVKNLRALATLGRLDITESIDVDTSGEIDLEAVLLRLGAALARCSPAS